jgi:lysophospholipase L1-like esterase
MSIIPTRTHEATAAKLRSAPEQSPGGRLGLGTVASLGVLAGLSSAVLALIGQARSTTRSIEAAALEAALADGTLVPPAVPGGTAAQQSHADHLVHVRLPQGEGVYSPAGELISDAAADATELLAPIGSATARRPLVLAMLGDSTSVGYGVSAPAELPGVILATGVAKATGRHVRMRSLGLTGARSTDLARQLTECLVDPPDIAVILIGANDLRDMVPPWRSAGLLGSAVRTLTDHGVPVVVGTCPDFGVIIGIPQPLRGILGTWSTGLAALQDRAVVEAGGATVALGRLVGPQFAGKPEMFARDHFHPSGAGYGRAMAAMLPTLIAELDRRAEPAHGANADEARSA